MKKVLALMFVLALTFIRAYSHPKEDRFDWRKVKFINGIGEPSEDDSYMIDVYGSLNGDRKMLFRCIVYRNSISIEVGEVKSNGEVDPYFVGYNDLKINFKNEVGEELTFTSFACTTGVLIYDDIKGPKKYRRIDDLLKRSEIVEISIYNGEDTYVFQVECDDYKE